MKEIRYGFYCFLARCFEREADEELLNKIAGMSLPKSEGVEGLKEKADTDELAADFAAVFLGAGQAAGNAAFPYESVYTSAKGLVMQEAWSQVKDIMDASGRYFVSEDKTVKEDHAAAELLYMALLIKSDESVSSQRDFFDNHIKNWFSRFLADVEQYAKTPFYKGLAVLSQDFIDEEDDYLAKALKKEESETLSCSLSKDEADRILSDLKKRYKIYAPVVVSGNTGKNGENEVRYREISSVKDIVTDRPSDYSPKEIYYPIVQTMFYFEGDKSRESTFTEDKDYLIVMRACDVNAIKRLDDIFLKNGGREDSYYERHRSHVKIALLECERSFEQCFCVSMGSAVADEYDMALRISPDGLNVKVASGDLKPYFKDAAKSAYEPSFVKENERKVALPVINSADELRMASTLEFWKKYDDKCISCGGCNTVCPTCSCFDTVDIRYDETSTDGERRRVWSSCMLDTFTMTAGGARSRKSPAANMRFKTLHKVYDFQKRFETDYNMCVGCGRCIARCPEDINFSDTVNGFSNALNEAKGGIS